VEPAFFDEILEDVRAVLQKTCFADGKVRVRPLPRTAFDNLLRKPEPRDGEPEELWISLDDVYPNPAGENETKINLSITRYIDSNGEKLGHGPRPEYRDRDLQLDAEIAKCVQGILARLSDREMRLVIVDDGTFDGGTIVDALDILVRHNVFVEQVRLGVAKPKGVKTISSWTKKAQDGTWRSIPFISASKLCPPIKDWVCERDFFPGVLYAGKVIGTKDPNGRLLPLRVGDARLPVRAQYLDGWGNPDSASLPPTSKQVATVALLDVAIKLWTRIQDWVGTERPILVRDLPAIPRRLYDKNAERMNERLSRPWIDELKRQRDRIDRNLVPSRSASR
jgi:hypothetical protein